MPRFKDRHGTTTCLVAVAAITTVSMAVPTRAEIPNTSASNVNVLNLLAPCLALNATPVGQATLTQSLYGTVAVNNSAATSRVISSTSISEKGLFGGVSNTGANQDIYGSSRPVQAAPNRLNGYDLNGLTGLTTNPSFPSGHTTYAYTDGILTGMLVPQDYQSMLLRAPEYGDSRIALGVHCPLDIIASRSFVQYDLAQEFDGVANYTNLQNAFTTAQPALASYLNAQAGGCSGTPNSVTVQPGDLLSPGTLGATTGSTMTVNGTRWSMDW